MVKVPPGMQHPDNSIILALCKKPQNLSTPSVSEHTCTCPIQARWWGGQGVPPSLFTPAGELTGVTSKAQSKTKSHNPQGPARKPFHLSRALLQGEAQKLCKRGKTFGCRKGHQEEATSTDPVPSVGRGPGLGGKAVLP